jgi:hypothetical protein
VSSLVEAQEAAYRASLLLGNISPAYIHADQVLIMPQHHPVLQYPPSEGTRRMTAAFVRRFLRLHAPGWHIDPTSRRDSELAAMACERRRDIVLSHLGVSGDLLEKPERLEELAERYGIARERVRQEYVRVFNPRPGIDTRNDRAKPWHRRFSADQAERDGLPPYPKIAEAPRHEQ